MSEGFIIGNGGTNLNFKVIAVASEDALPETAKENTIAVVTDTAITSWVFASTAPETPEAGMVWIKTGTGGTANFNAIKKNGLWVYPQACQQYVGDAWISKMAKTWQDGAWVRWELNIWPNVNNLEFTKKLNDSTDNAAITIDQDNPAKITLKVWDSTAGYLAVCNYSTLVDLTNYSTLTLKMSFSTGRQGGAGVLTANSGCANSVATGYSRTSSGAATVDNTYDISALTGVYWVGFWGNGSNTAVNTVFTVEEFTLR